MSLMKRFGNFFMLVGFILLVLFFASDYLDQVNGWYLLFGLILFVFGVRLAWKGRTPPEPSQRFRTVKKIMGGRDKGDKQKEDRKQE